jgi:hypothetical protein
MDANVKKPDKLAGTKKAKPELTEEVAEASKKASKSKEKDKGQSKAEAKSARTLPRASRGPRRLLGSSWSATASPCPATSLR